MTPPRKRPEYLDRSAVEAMIAEAVKAERERSDKVMGASSAAHGGQAPLEMKTFPMMQKK